MSAPNYLPKSVWSALGNVPVTQPKSMAKGRLIGRYRYFKKREINIAPETAPETAAQTLGHEIAHMILIDSGLTNLLTKTSEETICDAFGTWLAGAVIAGKVVLK